MIEMTSNRSAAPEEIGSIDTRGTASLSEVRPMACTSPSNDNADDALAIIAELEHRIKNIYAVIHALAASSLSGDRHLDERRQVFIGRLEALARTERWISTPVWAGTDLHELAHVELQPFSRQVVITGPHLVLDASTARGLALALHELATNAAKYGALSAPEGHVILEWEVETDVILRIHWRERGGPPVRHPTRTGFGTSLLKAHLQTPNLTYAPAGFELEARLPLPPAAYPVACETSDASP